MTIRDIPQELLQNAERRRRALQVAELHAAIIEGILYLITLTLYCLALRALVK